MKNIYLVFIFLNVAALYAQKCGNYKINIQGSYNSDSPKFNVWTTEEGFDYANYEFHESVAGLDDMEAKVKEIFMANGYSKVPKGKIKGFKGSDVSDANNNSQVHKSIQNGKTELVEEWKLGNQVLLAIAMSDGYSLTVYNIYK